MIVKPQLPPKAGYVEKVDADGNHYYAPTEETVKAEAAALEMEQLKEALDMILNGVTE